MSLTHIPLIGFWNFFRRLRLSSSYFNPKPSACLCLKVHVMKMSFQLSEVLDSSIPVSRKFSLSTRPFVGKEESVVISPDSSPPPVRLRYAACSLLSSPFLLAGFIPRKYPQATLLTVSPSKFKSLVRMFVGSV